jgi:hypothetical protein
MQRYGEQTLIDDQVSFPIAVVFCSLFVHTIFQVDSFSFVRMISTFFLKCFPLEKLLCFLTIVTCMYLPFQQQQHVNSKKHMLAMT